MFCDLVDSTHLAGQLDPENLRDVVRAYQMAHEDDAPRAVHTALAILEVMRQLNNRLDRERQVRLAVHLGLHTGQKKFSGQRNMRIHARSKACSKVAFLYHLRLCQCFDPSTAASNTISSLGARAIVNAATGRVGSAPSYGVPVPGSGSLQAELAHPPDPADVSSGGVQGLQRHGASHAGDRHA
jgi:hypothetical protein